MVTVLLLLKTVYIPSPPAAQAPLPYRESIFDVLVL